MDWRRAIEATADCITPVAVVDEAVMEENLAAMQHRAAKAGLRLRPHAKTHKSVWIARRQLALGATGLTVATLREASVFAAAGVADILIVHPPVGAAKLQALERLAARVPRFALAVDSVEVAQSLPGTVEVMWEVDSGLGRLGTQPGPPTARAVTQLVEAIGRERFRGLLTHAGHVYRARSQAERHKASGDEAEALVATATLLREAGIEVLELSVGSTPTAADVQPGSGLTEMRPGTYVFGDANQVRLGSHTLETCALGLVATVVSRPGPGRAVIDAGSKAISTDLRVPGQETFAEVLGPTTAVLDRLSEEHGVLRVEDGDLAVGDRVVMLPAHSCTMLNLHDRVLVLEPGGGSRYEPVDARGWALS